MRRVIEGYIGKEFLMDYVLNMIQNPPGDIEERMSFDRFIMLIRQHAKLFTPIENSDLILIQSRSTVLFRLLYGLYETSNLITSHAPLSNLLDKKDSSPYKFFFGEFKENGISEKKIGFPLLSQDCFFDKWRKLEVETELAVSQEGRDEDSMLHWDDLNHLRMPIHSIVITDPYLFSGKYNFDNNVKKLLARILPKGKVEYQIHLTILTQKFYFLSKNGPEEDISKIYTKIKNYINYDLNIKNINIALVKKSKTSTASKKKSNEEIIFHDRLIFTNVFVYNSGNSLSYFDHYGKIRLNNITDFKIIPVTSLAKDKSQNYNSRANYYRKHLKLIHRIIHNLSSEDKCHGNKKNRLLEWAAKQPD